MLFCRLINIVYVGHETSLFFSNQRNDCTIDIAFTNECCGISLLYTSFNLSV